MMRSRFSARAVLAAAAALASAGVGAQAIHTYTENSTGPTQRPLGYPVPEPVASLQAVDGFRDYASIEARLQSLALSSDDLAAHDIGATQQYQRPVWAYVIGDANAVDVEGRTEAAFFINAGIHAREWGTQEVSTWLVERMVAGSGDGGVVRWLLDNTRLVVVPVHNVDGFLQTQRYPTRVVVGSDPRVPSDWPRDGRMRRKNMRGVDESLESFGDHLGGIDLNRNHPPYWATDLNPSTGSSTNPAELVYHGSGAHSESESQALVQGVLLAGPERLRLGIDIHSFSQVFYSANTGRSRLNAIQNRLLDRLTRHHRIASRRSDGTAGSSYRNVPDPPGAGLGTVAEYLGHEYLVPAWTLELEPDQTGGRRYGGTADSHSGFILPATEVRRVREGWAESHIVAFYFMAGAPHLAELRIVDSASGVMVVHRLWERQGDQRALRIPVDTPLAPGRRYRAELVFNKPMRVRAEDGSATGFPGLGIGSTGPSLLLAGAGGDIAVDTADGTWLENGARYAYDSYAVEFDAPATLGAYSLRVDTTDATGLKLDARPATPVDWFQGAWTGWENDAGNAGDSGGADASHALHVGAASLQVLGYDAVLGEGDIGRVRLSRSGGGDAVEARLVLSPAPAPGGACADLVATVVAWQQDEDGERSLPYCVQDDLLGTGSRLVQVTVTAGAGNDTLTAFDVQVLDNDVPGAPAVVRVTTPFWLGQALLTGAAADVVLDASTYVFHELPFPACPQRSIAGPLRVFGNHAILRPGSSGLSCELFNVEGGPVELRDLTLLSTAADGPGVAPGLLAASGELRLRNVHAEGIPPESTIAFGNALIGSSTLIDAERLSIASSTGLSAALAANAMQLRSSAVVDVQAPSLLELFGGGDSTIQSSSLHVQAAGGHALRLPNGAQVALGGNLLQESPPAGTLCTGAGAPTSLGHNRAADTSCGLAAQDDVAPVAIVVEARDSLTGAPFPTGSAIDAGGDCPAVDLRGAPRPQTLTPGAEPRCDAGAIELGANPYRGLWIPDRPGHGIDIHTAGNQLFLTWYTYAGDGTPAAYLAAAPLTGPVWRATLHSARRLADGSIEEFDVGEIELEFASDVVATLRWRFGDTPQWTEEGLQAYFFAAGEPRFETTGAWFAPAEPGHGLTVTRRGGITGLVLYYYDSDGVLRWALGQGRDADVVDAQLLGFTGFCPDCDATANPPTPQPVGTLRVQFLTPERARVWIDAGYGTGARFIRNDAAFVPINDPVDNRAAAALGQPAASR